MAEKDVAWVRKEYEKIRQKNNLPGFEEMNNEFEIERLLERDTELFARRLRRCVVEKIVHVLRFLETMVNPQSAPVFIHSILDHLNADTQKIIEKLYEKGCRIEMRSFAFDAISDDKSEIAFTKEIIKEWSEMKKDMIILNKEIDKTWHPKEEKRKASMAG